MATRKAAGTAKNLSDSQPKYLGVKLYAGEKANPGSIIVRQRGSKILAGKNVQSGKDYTLYSVATGKVKYTSKKKKNVDGTYSTKKVANVE